MNHSLSISLFLYINMVSCLELPPQQKSISSLAVFEFLSFKMKVLGIRALPLLVGLLVMTSLAEQGKGNLCTRTFFSSLVQLIPCRAAVAPFSPIPPSEACCEALKVLGQPCLCVLINGPPISGVDRKLAMELPEKCTASFDPCEAMK